jgi:hypothetical protein
MNSGLGFEARQAGFKLHHVADQAIYGKQKGAQAQNQDKPGLFFLSITHPSILNQPSPEPGEDHQVQPQHP